MFCHNCGNSMNDNERFCSKCGTLRTGAREAVCRTCGSELQSGAAFCDKCGAQVGATANTYANNAAPVKSGKSKIAAGLLGIFLGYLGVHNFYLGYTKKAVTQLVLYFSGYVVAAILYILGTILSVIYIGLLLYIPAFLFMLAPIAVSIWTLIEGRMILAGSIKVDGNGNPLVD